jgi:hypothetical protein
VLQSLRSTFNRACFSAREAEAGRAEGEEDFRVMEEEEEKEGAAQDLREEGVG